jgi:uncharacterized protein
MDKLLNEFTVNRPVDEAWAVLTDVERIAPCMPGATLEEIEGDVYRGVVKVKLGAISAAFKGQASFVERDDAAHRAVLHGEGRDTTGKGNADALITASLRDAGAGRTDVVVETELRITGKVAQFGRGIMQDVSKKLLAQFATNLNTMLDEGASGAGAGAAPAPAGDTSATAGEDATGAEAPDDGAVAAATLAATGAATTGTSTSSAGSPASGTAGTADPAAIGGNGSPAEAAEPPRPATVRKIDGPANEPIELSDVARGAILKRLVPVAGGIALVLLVLRRLRRR